MDPAPPRLNVVNALAYVANVVVTYGSQLGWFGRTNQQQSLRYQTLATPIGFAFAIWGPIFLLQAVFAVVQLIPKYRGIPVVVDGIWYHYALVCIAQAGWTVAFAQDSIWLSMVFMLLIFGGLSALNLSVVRVEARHLAGDMHPASHYLCFRAPFLLHLGWITAATFVNANVYLVRYWKDDHSLQLGGAIATIALLVLPGLYNPTTSPTFAADPLYSLVLAWAFFGVHKELAKTPLEGVLSEWCPRLVSSALSGVAALMASGLLVTVLVRVLRRVSFPIPKPGGASEAGEASAPVYPRSVGRSDEGDTGGGVQDGGVGMVEGKRTGAAAAP